MNIGVNRLELKETKRVQNLLEKEMENRSNNGKKLDDLKGDKLREEMERINQTLKTDKKIMYSKIEITDSINEIIQRKNIKQTQGEISKLIDSLYSQNLKSRELKDIDFDSKEGKLSISILHESFDINQFRNDVYTVLSDLYFSVFIEISSPYALVFINAGSVYFGKIRDILRNIVNNDFAIQTIKWHDDALRNIADIYGSEVTNLGAKGVEGFVYANAKAKEGLNSTAMKIDLDKGNWTSVGFNFKDSYYPNNQIFINGTKGYLSSDLSDDDLKKFIKNELIKYSTKN